VQKPAQTRHSRHPPTRTSSCRWPSDTAPLNRQNPFVQHVTGKHDMANVFSHAEDKGKRERERNKVYGHKTRRQSVCVRNGSETREQTQCTAMPARYSRARVLRSLRNGYRLAITQFRRTILYPCTRAYTGVCYGQYRHHTRRSALHISGAQGFSCWSYLPGFLPTKTSGPSPRADK